MVKLAKFLHAQAFHQSPRGRVCRYREAHHAVQPETVEGELQGGFRRLPGQAFSLSGRGQAPANLDSRREKCFPGNVRQPAEPDQRPTLALLQSLEAPPVPRKVRIDPVEHGVRTLACEGQQITPHARFGIDGREGRAAFRALSTEAKAGAFQVHADEYGYRGRSSQANHATVTGSWELAVSQFEFRP
jgi:hypothetical protein